MYLKSNYEKKICLKEGIDVLLDFDYDDGYVNIFEDRRKVLCITYSYEQQKTGIVLEQVYVNYDNDKRKGYGIACLREVLSIIVEPTICYVKGKLGEADIPKEFASKEEYLDALEAFYVKLGFDVDKSAEKIYKKY